MLVKQYIDSNTLKKEIFEGVLFFSVAEWGAMGVPGQVIVVNNKPAAFAMNQAYGDERAHWRTILEMFPVLKQCRFGIFGFDSKVPEGWNYVNLGLGNHLIVADEVYEEFRRLTAHCKEEFEFYRDWQDAARRIVGLPDKGDTL